MKPIIIKPGQEFQLNDAVFVYELNNEGGVTISLIRRIFPKITDVTVVKPKRKKK